MSTASTQTICVDCSSNLAEKCSVCEKDIPPVVNTTDNVVASTRSHTLEQLAKNVLEKLDHQGYCVIDKFHKEEKALAIVDEVKSIHAMGLMHNGQLTNTSTSESIRGDLIKWIGGKEAGTENITLHMRRVDALIREMKKMITYHRIEGRTKV